MSEAISKALLDILTAAVIAGIAELASILIYLAAWGGILVHLFLSGNVVATGSGSSSARCRSRSASRCSACRSSSWATCWQHSPA